jgi:hypothetical protein
MVARNTPNGAVFVVVMAFLLFCGVIFCDGKRFDASDRDAAAIVTLERLPRLVFFE